MKPDHQPVRKKERPAVHQEKSIDRERKEASGGLITVKKGDRWEGVKENSKKTIPETFRISARF